MANKIQVKRGLKSKMPSSAAVGEPMFSTDTNEMFMGTGSGIVNMGGSHWYSGTAMSGTSTTTGAYYYSGCPEVKVGDYYLNTSYGYVYECTTAGSGTTAKWTYKGSIRGAAGSNASVTLNGSSSSSPSFYAPTGAGTAGHELVSNGSGAPVWKQPNFATCSTGASTAAKTASISNFTLVTGARVLIKFTNAHTSSTAATLNVNSTGAKTIIQYSGTTTINVVNGQSWAAGETVEFVYDGTYWRAIASDMGFISGIRKNVNRPQSPIIPNDLTVGSRASGTYGTNTFTSGSGHKATEQYAACIGGFQNEATASGGVVVGSINSEATEYYGAVISGAYAVAKSYQAVFGHFNNEGTGGNQTGTTGDALIIGNGTPSTTSNAFRVTYAGGVYGKAAYNSTGADYAEMFEWEDGNPNGEDRRGLFAYIVGDKVRLATAADTDRRRMGIISAFPAVVGDNFDEDWHGKYLTDIYGKPLTQIVHHDAVYNDDGECVMEECDAEELIINPDYDPDMEYVPRTQRKEYAYWSFIGKLVVRDDGTCEADGYCYPGTDGVATACTDPDKGYYVMERLDDNHIRVLVR